MLFQLQPEGVPFPGPDLHCHVDFEEVKRHGFIDLEIRNVKLAKLPPGLFVGTLEEGLRYAHLAPAADADRDTPEILAKLGKDGVRVAKESEKSIVKKPNAL